LHDPFDNPPTSRRRHHGFSFAIVRMAGLADLPDRSHCGLQFIKSRYHARILRCDMLEVVAPALQIFS